MASNSLLVNETNCSPVVAAETAMMTKERVAEVYGPITHTIGMGGSGGAIMQYTITHAYPGILDGLLPSASFPDAFTNTAPSDCTLLLRYLATPAGSTLTAAQRQAIGGHRTFAVVPVVGGVVRQPHRRPGGAARTSSPRDRSGTR